jgi:hypothetical protein
VQGEEERSDKGAEFAEAELAGQGEDDKAVQNMDENAPEMPAEGGNSSPFASIQELR